jgi:flavin-dependent dehydrogenase
MKLTRNSCDVVIGGAGIAAAATALRLLALGFRPLLLARACKSLPGVEAIPEATLVLFGELGAMNILQEAGGTRVRGFENRWNPDKPTLRPGYWIHVERDRLAKAAVGEAVKRGATFRVCQALPQLRQECDSVWATYDGACLRFEAAIDATGRSAVWSRPIRRRGNQTADLYDVCPGDLAPGEIARLSEGWAYKIGVANRTTVAILSCAARRRDFSDSLTQKTLQSQDKRWTFIGRRPAFSQWSERPVLGRRLAVGDAALAYDPLAGQGIRFALSSAITAASVVNTWRTVPSKATAAERYYDAFVARSRQSHLRFIDQLQTESFDRFQGTIPVPEAVMFSGSIVQTDLQIQSKIRTDAVILLPNGDCVRWLGKLDLLQLRSSLPRCVRSRDLLEHLAPIAGGHSQALAVIKTCLRHQILRPATSGTSEPNEQQVSIC